MKDPLPLRSREFSWLSPDGSYWRPFSDTVKRVSPCHPSLAKIAAGASFEAQCAAVVLMAQIQAKWLCMSRCLFLF